MKATGLGAARGSATNKGNRQDVADTVWSTIAATWANPITAPAISATITVLYSISLPV